jgi:hypothetical protein
MDQLEPIPILFHTQFFFPFKNKIKIWGMFHPSSTSILDIILCIGDDGKEL